MQLVPLAKHYRVRITKVHVVLLYIPHLAHIYVRSSSGYSPPIQIYDCTKIVEKRDVLKISVGPSETARIQSLQYITRK